MNLSGCNFRLIFLHKSLMVAGCCMALLGCGEREQVKTFAMCLNVAEQLEQYKAERQIDAKLQEYVLEHRVRISSRDMMYMQDEINNDLDLAGRNPGAAVMTLIKTYNSAIGEKLILQL